MSCPPVCVFPDFLRPREAFTEYFQQQVNADLGALGVRDSHNQITTNHVRLLAAFQWPLEAESTKPLYQLTSRDRRKLRQR